MPEILNSSWLDKVSNELEDEIIKEYEQEWLNIVDEVKEYTDNSGEKGGLTFGFPILDEAFNGFNAAVYQLGGPSNTGKSALCLQLAWNVALLNENTYCIYFALDDSINDMLPRIIAMDKRIPISSIKYPKKYADQPNILRRRIEGFNTLKTMAPKFKLRDLNFGDSIEYIEKTVQEHKSALPSDCKLCIFIDNFFDIQVEEKNFKNNNEKYEYLAVQLEKISQNYGCPIMCTAELRKLNGNRRPILDDLRETIKIVYKAKAVMLCYNEVGIRGQNAEVYWMQGDNDDKLPILEVYVAKNKLGEYKGRIFYEFWPAQSFLVEVPAEAGRLYNQRISV